jgi:DNA-binding response OmpR family regulator
MLNVIIVEDHKDLRESLLDVIAAEGHNVAAFESAEALWSGCSFVTVDILILDLNLPGADGIAVAHYARAKHPNLGIVMLTARGEPEERRIGYESGADIYLAKPSSPTELTASIMALARRLKQNQSEHTSLVLDPIAMTLSGIDAVVGLSVSEVELVVKFISSPQYRLEISEISELLGRDGDITKAAIEVRVVRLRKKMIAAGAPSMPIKVVRNHGYQLAARIDVL